MSQTDQMQAERVCLVIPAMIQSSYREEQRLGLMSMADFVDLVSNRQGAVSQAEA